MTNAIYLKLHGNNDISGVYSALHDCLKFYCGEYNLPKTPPKSCMLFDSDDSTGKNILERRLAGENNGFLENISLVFGPETNKLTRYLGFKPEYSIGFITITDLEPEKIRNGAFAVDIANGLKQKLNCQYCVVLMNDINKTKWEYIKDH